MNSCLNCGKTLHGPFCTHCGQSAHTHRFTLKTILSHDFLHSIFHIQSGFFFTLSHLLYRPGHVAREYIAGQRVRYTNYFTLLVVLILMFHFVETFTHFSLSSLIDTADDKAIMDVFDEWVKKYPKVIFLGIIPIYAFISFLFFRQAKLNYAEHLVLNAYRMATTLILNIFFLLIVSVISDRSTIIAIDRGLGIITLTYSVTLYYQFFSTTYKTRWLLLIRSILCVLIFIPLLALTILGIQRYITG